MCLTAEYALDVGALRGAAVTEHEVFDAGGEQLANAPVREHEVVLVEVLLRGAAPHVAGERAAAEQIADERDLATTDDDDDRARRVRTDHAHFAVDPT